MTTQMNNFFISHTNSLYLLYFFLYYFYTLHTASFGQGSYMDFSLERPDATHPVLSKYDKKLRANSKSELPQKRKDKDFDRDRDRDRDKEKDKDKSKDDSQLRLSSLTTDLTSCRGIGTFLPYSLPSSLPFLLPY